MRLINTTTGEFEEFFDQESTPAYAILSHTWDKKEQTYQEVVKIQEKYQDQSPRPEKNPGRYIQKITHMLADWRSSAFSSKRYTSMESPHRSEVKVSTEIRIPHTPLTTRRSIWDANSGLSEKIRRACEIARNNGYRYIWIDPCCIDKTSSSELSEAINSMFIWYRAAHVCYAFLVDVPSDDDTRAKYSKFRTSRWFHRCWTLQELVAPRVLVFLSKDWKRLGTKKELAEITQNITSIDVQILTHERELSDESVANRMRWASRRQATRVEDEAYSLLGIFGITMSTLYGEGRYAFRRLQEEILHRIPDQSLFVWGSEDIAPFPMGSRKLKCRLDRNETLLASSPRDFTMKGNQITLATEESVASIPLPVEEYPHTPYGIRMRLCLLPLKLLNPDLIIKTDVDPTTVIWYIAIFPASTTTNLQSGELLGQLCYLRDDPNAKITLLYRISYLFQENHRPTSSLYSLSLAAITGMENLETYLKTVYLPHPKPSNPVSTTQLKSFQDYHFGPGVNQLSLNIPMRTQYVLRASGFISNIQGPTEPHYNSLSFTLRHARFNIHIIFRFIISPSWFLIKDDSVIIKTSALILPPGPDKEGLHATYIQVSPSSDSTTWVAQRKEVGLWHTTLSSQDLILTPDFMDKVTVSLSLGLDLTTLFQYTLRVDRAPQIVGDIDRSFQPDWKDSKHNKLELELPYKTLDFILPGSVRRALETKGYSACLSFEPSLGDTHSHSLTLSTNSDAGKFSIVVKCLQVHMLDNAVLARSDLNVDFGSDPEAESGSQRRLRDEKFVIVARITVESSDGASETVHDGPHVVAWKDSYPWNRNLGPKDVILTTPTGDPLILQLGFDLAWLFQYYLHVNVTPSPPDLSSTPTRITRYHDGLDLLPGWAHRGISLTVPTHVNRALQALGFQVRFETLEDGGTSGDPIHHVLTLSHTRAGFDIVIEYFHYLTTRYPDPHSDPNDPEVEERYGLLQANPQLASDPSLHAPTAKASVKRCRQVLTFKASIQTSTSNSAQIGDTPSQLAVLDDITTVEVDRQDSASWKRHLERKDITLTLPTGRQLVLRLGCDLVWYSEYCPTVEINPRTPLPPHWSNDWKPSPMPDYELGDDGMEYIRQSSAQSAEPGVGKSAEAPNDDPEPLLADLSMLEELPVWSSGEPKEAENSGAEEQPREGAAVEAQDEPTERLAHSATHSEADNDMSDVDGDAK